jgi:CHAD domain-containing protein
MAVVLDEIETKYAVGTDAALPAFEMLPEVGSIAEEDQLLRATYFDTDDRALLRSGVTLRRRTGGDDEGWHLKLPDTSCRHEVHEPLGEATDLPPERLVALTWGLHRGRPLSAAATIETHRMFLRLNDAGGRPLADVCDDRVTARPLDRSGRAKQWREWEIEVAPAADQWAAPAAREVARLMVDAGASPAASPNKFAHVLRVPPRRRPHTTKGSAADVLAPLLDAQVAELRRLDPLVRADTPDAVHRMRVLGRRLRAELGVYQRLFDRSVTEAVRTDLAWVVAELGRPRDAEVLQAGLEALSIASSAASRQLPQEHHAAHQRAVASLTTARYLHLLDTLDCIAAHPPWRRAASRPARRELLRRVRSRAHRMVGATAAVDRAPTRQERDLRLHDVRKEARKLRYAIEAGARTLGPEAESYALLLSQLQDVLGDQHDNVVARARVDRLAADLAPAVAASARATLAETARLHEMQYGELLPGLIGHQWLAG